MAVRVAGSAAIERIASDCAYIDELVSLIPPHLYFPPDEERVQSRFLKHSKKELPTLSELKARRADAKRARLDPAQNAKSVLDLQRENKARQKREREEMLERGRADAGGMDDDGEEGEEEEGEEEEGEKVKGSEEEGSEAEGSEEEEEEEERGGEEEEGADVPLKERMARKMAELRKERGADAPGTEAKASAKRDARKAERESAAESKAAAAEKAARRKAKQAKAKEREESFARKATGRAAAEAFIAAGGVPPVISSQPKSASLRTPKPDMKSVDDVSYAQIRTAADRKQADTRVFQPQGKGLSSKQLLLQAQVRACLFLCLSQPHARPMLVPPCPRPVQAPFISTLP
ncbi:hypothetical protein T492DRAFT_310710 [Pavlovales sp. CCMP2436]|nr:hypothetical protein T492DRAFT_310710 [Pavlovales sp. CCMP2436]